MKVFSNRFKGISELKENLILYCIALFLGAIVMGCKVKSNPNPKIVIWETSEIGVNSKSKFYKVEHYTKNGHLAYDSTVFPSSLGYKVQHYERNKLVTSFAYYEPNTLIIEEHEYDNNDNLLRSIVLENGDTTQWEYLNQYDSNQVLRKVIGSASGESVVSEYVELSYDLDNLILEKYFRVSGVDSTLLRRVEHAYDDKSRLRSSVVNDLFQDLKDSLIIDYEERSRTTYRSLRGSKYGVINMETYSEDSLSIRSKDLRIDQDIILKKNVQETW